jgi:hypothetical protein
MLEILLVIGLCKKIGGILERKGRHSGWYKFFVVVGWFGGEFAGGVVAGVACAIFAEGREHFAIIYGSALGGAALSVGLVFSVASMLPDVHREEPARAFPNAPLPANVLNDNSNPYRAPNFSDPS